MLGERSRGTALAAPTLAPLRNRQALQAEAAALNEVQGLAGRASHGAVDLRLGHGEALS